MSELHIFELSLIKNIQQIRSPILDQFFKFVNLFDTIEFYLLLIAVVWIAIYWKWGVKLFFLLLINGIINSFLKNFWMQPRPSHIEPSLGLINFSSYGLPSGAAQASIVLALFFFSLYKNKKQIWPYIVFYPLFIGFSRIYLGTHFISDVIVGYIVGLVIIFLYFLIIKHLEKFFSRRSFGQFFLIILLIGFILILLPMKISLLYGYVLLGMGVGLYFGLKKNLFLNKVKDFKEFLIRAILGAGAMYGLMLLFFALPKESFALLKVLLLMAIGLWISLISSLVLRFFLKDTKV